MLLNITCLLRGSSRRHARLESEEYDFVSLVDVTEDSSSLYETYIAVFDIMILSVTQEIIPSVL
jgi:hypothetical protein